MKHTTRALAVFLLALAMVIGLLPGLGMTAKADGNVKYIQCTWDSTEKKLSSQEKTLSSEYTELTNDTTSAAFDNGKWYVVSGGNVQIADRIVVTGTANLILADGAKLTAKKGINVPEGATLNIYGQTNQTGALVIDGVEENNAGIGGNLNGHGGVITIEGGKIDVTGGKDAAGIGGGDIESGTWENTGTVTINGGTVKATGGDGGAGIGGGDGASGGNVTINGGAVTATGSNYGAGIGGGWGGNGGNVTINGGTVITSGTEQTVNGTKQVSMGIGSGYNANGMNNGTLTLGQNMYLYANDSTPNPGKSADTADNVTRKDNDYARKRYMDINGEQAGTAYTITVAESENGTVTADMDKAKAGLTVTLTATPDNKCGFNDIKAVQRKKPTTVDDIIKAAGNNIFRNGKARIVVKFDGGNALTCDEEQDHGWNHLSDVSKDAALTYEDGVYSCYGSNEILWIFTLNDVGKVVNIKVENTVFTGESEYPVGDALGLNRAGETLDFSFTMPEGDVVVSASFVKQHVHTVNGEDIVFQPWDGTSSLPNVEGNWYLTNNIDLTPSAESGLTMPSGTTNLCLNGHYISGNSGAFSVITVPSGATLNVYDFSGKEGEDTDTASTPGRITGGKGTSITYGGNTFIYGGGILVQGGTLNMYGGTITGNQAENGGGVAVVDKGTFKGTFNMYGGSVSGNTATRDAQGKGHGGGVFVSRNGKFNMSGGVITGNNAMNGELSVLDDATAVISDKAEIIVGDGDEPNQAIHVNGKQNGAAHLTISGGTVNGGSKHSVTFEEGGETDSFTLSGDPTITGTLLLATENAKIKLDSYQPTEGKKLTVDMSYPGVFTTDGTFDTDSDAQAMFTTPADSIYMVVKDDGSKEAKLVVEPVPYLEWDEASKQLKSALPRTDYKVVTAETTTLGEADKETWYVVKSDVTNKNSITINGNVHLILCDGKTLTVTATPTGEHPAVIGGTGNLTIYGQENQTGALKVTATGTADAIRTGGGNLRIDGGRITVQGKDGEGTINEKSGLCATQEITINGGVINASGSTYGIYAGQKTVTVNGGTVTARGKHHGIFATNPNNGGVTVNGGTVSASSETSDKEGIFCKDLKVATTHVAYSNGSEITADNKNNSQHIMQGEGDSKPLGITPMQYMLVQKGIMYQSLSWNAEQKQVDVTDQICDDYIVVTPSMTTLGNDETTWYAVTDDTVNIGGRVTVAGTVNLILVNGKEMTARKGITTTGATLNIYGQKQGTGTTLGKLQASATSETGCAGIGGNNGQAGGTLTIHGGDIMGQGAKDAAGIGGGAGGAGGTITIYGGEVKNLVGGNNDSAAAGIGGGAGGASGKIAIYGGIVIANTDKDASAIGASKDVRDIDLTLGEGMVLTTGPDVNHLLPCLDYVEHRKQEIEKGTIGNIKSVQIRPHTHNMTWQKVGDNDAALEGTCSNADCSFKDNKVTYTINADEDATYDGNEHVATVSAVEMAHGELEASSITISYASVDPETGDATSITGKPVDAGKYRASFTMGTGVTANKDYTINPAALTNISVAQDGTLTYTGEAQAPEVSASAESVNSQPITFTYSLTADGEYTETVPAITNVSEAGTFYYKVSAPNHNEASGSFNVTMNPATAEAPTGLTATYGDTLADVTLPDGWTWKDKGTAEVGDVGDNKFLANYHDAAGNYADQSDVELTVKVSAAPAVVTKAPTAKSDLTYTGEPQELIESGEATGGTLLYSLDGENYSADIPKGTDAKPYTVYYKVDPDGNHTGTDASELTVEIASADTDNTKPSAEETLVYDGKAHNLVKGGSVTGGDLMYAIGTDGTTAPALDAFTKTVPTGTDAGDYPVWYYVKGDENHNDVLPPVCIPVTIARAAIEPKVSLTGWNYGEKANEPTVTGNPGNGAVTITYSDKADGTFTKDVPVNAGTWYVKATVAETGNYKGGEATLSFAIARANVVITAEDKTSVYGEDIAALTYQLSGKVAEGDDLGVSLSTTATKGSKVDAYPITVSFKENANYTVTANNGAYTVTTRAATVTALDQTITEGQSVSSDPSMAKLSGQAEGHVLTGIRIAVQQSNGLASNATTYTLTVSDAKISDAAGNDVTANYTITYTSGKVTVNPKPTEQPTVEPTVKPTEQPTAEPTAKPTAKPTTKPTAKPTAKPTTEPTAKPTAKPTVKPTTEPTAKPTVKPTAEPKVVTPDYTLLAQMKTSGNNALKVCWSKVKDANGYDVFFAKCGGNYKAKATASITGTSVKFNGLKKGVEYKAYVQAWKWKNGRKAYIGKPSPEVHSIAGGYNSRSCNTKSVSLNRSSLTLKVGKSKTVRASVKAVKSGRKVLQHERLVRWYSSNSAVATVDKNGRIRAVGKGACRIYAIANNGLFSSVKVTVK